MDGLFSVLSVAGSGLALAFVLAIAVGVFVLVVVYLGSAVVVLEQFAAAARGAASLAFCGGLCALAGAILGMRIFAPELSGASPAVWWPRFAAAVALSGALAALATLVSRALLARTDGAFRAAIVTFVLGLGGALWLAATARPAPALGGAAALAALALALGVRRGRRGGADPSALETQIRWLALLVSLGGVAAFLLPAPAPTLAAAGSALFGCFAGWLLLGLLPLAASGLLASRRSAEWFIALRYLVAKRRQVFISAITAICVGGIAAGVWLIVVVLSVMNGFERTWREEILGNRAHFTVHRSDGPIEDAEAVAQAVRDVPGVVAASPYLDAEGMVRGVGGDVMGVRVRGVDPAHVSEVTDLEADLLLGTLADLAAPGDPEGTGIRIPGIAIGNQLAVSAGVSVGDTLLLISPFGGPPTPLGPAPRLQRFQVVAVFQSSFFQYDEVTTYVSLEAAQEFRRSGPVVDGIEARSTDFHRSRGVGAAVAAALGPPYFARDWKEFFPAFFQALRTERIMMFVLLAMIMIVAAFLIVATLVMMIMEKSSDIAILKAMGAEDASIERIFAIEGTLIGLGGTVLGLVAGLAVTRQLDWIQDRIESLTGIDTLPSTVYQLSRLPSEVDPVHVAVVVGLAMVLSLGATLLPSRQGAQLDPALALRDE